MEIVDPKLTSTARVGYQPEIKQPVKLVNTGNISVSETPAIGTMDPSDSAKIQQFLETFTAVRARLADQSKSLENFLQNGLSEAFSIPYDPSVYPDLAEAHHHICGRPGAGYVITYADIKSRAAVERSQLAASIAIPTDLDSLGASNARTLQANISKSIAKQILQMLDAVWRQIIVWTLDLFYATVSPLNSVPVVNAIPKAIKEAIDRINSTPNASPNNIGDVLNSPTPTSGNITSADLANAGGGYISSVTEVIQNLPPQCLQHTATWNRIVEPIIRDGPYASAYYAKKTADGMIDHIDNLNKMAAIGIPQGHLFTSNGETVTYSNPLPQQYLQARANGATSFGAISDGLITSINEVNSTIVPKLDRLIQNMLQDPNLLCCLIRNITLMANTNSLKKTLLYIRALLQVWRNLHSLDIAKEVARLGNMIVDLLNRVLQSIFSLYLAYFNSELSKFGVKIKDLTSLKQGKVVCEPWNLLVNLGIEILNEMLQKIETYLTGFFLNFRLDIRRSSANLDEIQKLSNVDKYIALIDKILQFAAAWTACVENSQDPRLVLSGASRLSSTPTGVSLAPSSATSIGGQVSPSLTSAGSSINGVPTVGGQSTFAPDGPFSADGVQVLLTNFLGVSNQQARQVINNIDSCSCDKSLTPEELASIDAAITEGR